VDKTHAKGVELELEEKFASGLMARVSYVCQRAENSITGQELSNSPRNQAKLSLIVPLYKDKVFTGLEVVYTSPVRTLADNETDAYAIANLTLYSQKIVKGLEVSASIYNLFDTKYAFPGSADLREDTVTQDGRSFRVKLTYRF
jgi:iron complex outermembrane receptor protein